MSCTAEYERRNYSIRTLNYAMDDDAGSWWWWTNVIGKNTLPLLLFCI